MRAIEEIEQRLKKYPGVRVEKAENFIRVCPVDEDGFEVSLTEYDGGFTVSFDGWHEEFSDVELALNVFAFGLSDDCRLQLEYRGKSPHVWVVQEKNSLGEWQPCSWIGLSETGLIFSPFWLKKKIRFLQNNLISGSA